jgi:biopolymer transport protein ExbD
VNVVVLVGYALGVALVLAAGAWLLERALTSLHLPVRWVWIGTLGVSVWLPLDSFVSGTQQQSTVGVTSLAEVVAPITAPAVMEGMSGGSAQRENAALELLVEWRTQISRALASGAALLPEIGLAAGWIAGAWGASSILVAMILVVSILRLSRRARGWPDETLLGRSVKVSPDIGPATVGLLTPIIVIPRWARELPPHEFNLILSHEGEHVRSRDTLLLALGLVAVVACPWNPVAWWQMRRLKAAVEVDCDRRVLRDGVSPARYGDLLVRLGSRRRVGLLAAPTIVGSTSLLERRLTVMKNLRSRISVPTALVAAAVALILVAVACTSEVPMAMNDDDASEAPSATNTNAASEPQLEKWVTIRVDRDGTVQVNGVVHPLDRVSEAVAPLNAANAVVSLEVPEATPYGLVWELKEQLRAAGLVRVSFLTAESEAQRSPARDASTRVGDGLGVVLPELPAMPEVEVSPRNLLFLEVLPTGTVAVRRGEDPTSQLMVPREAEGVLRQELALNPLLIAVVKTHPETEYKHMYDVLDAIKRAEVKRFSLQVVE